DRLQGGDVELLRRGNQRRGGTLRRGEQLGRRRGLRGRRRRVGCGGRGRRALGVPATGEEPEQRGRRAEAPCDAPCGGPHRRRPPPPPPRLNSPPLRPPMLLAPRELLN